MAGISSLILAAIDVHMFTLDHRGRELGQISPHMSLGYRKIGRDKSSFETMHNIKHSSRYGIACATPLEPARAIRIRDHASTGRCIRRGIQSTYRECFVGLKRRLIQRHNAYGIPIGIFREGLPGEYSSIRLVL